MSDFNFTSLSITDTIVTNIYTNIWAIIGVVITIICVIAGIVVFPPEVKTGLNQKRFFDYRNNKLVVESEYVVDWKHSLYLKIFSKQFHISRKKEILLASFDAESKFKIYLEPLTSPKAKLCRDYFEELTNGDVRLITVRLDERSIKRKYFLHKHDEDHYFVEITTPQKDDLLKHKVTFNKFDLSDGSCNVIIKNNTTEIVHNYCFEMSSDLGLKEVEYAIIEGSTHLSNGNQNYRLKDIKPDTGEICISFVKRRVIPS
jgi:hypothetical protein